MKYTCTAALLLAATASVAPANAQTHTRTDTLTYEDNLSKWVIGQPKSSTNVETGLIESRTVYDPATALPLQSYAFEKLQQTMTYNADGTLATTVDGNNRTTSYTDWKRGIPQKTTFADGASKSAVVNGNGWITSVTDENGYITKYGYDAMGRINLIDYPDNDTVNWNNTTISFQPWAQGEYGIAGGHWRRVVNTGTANTVTFYDALWRPVITENYDYADTANTLTQTVTRYDADGRPTFQSYPQRSQNPVVFTTWGNPAAWPDALGTWTTYDALGRPTQVQQNSELGALTTTYQYLSGFLTLTTNPRNQQTLTGYQVFDQPSQDLPVGINRPEGVYDEIYRDVFGKPTALRRRNADVSISLYRRYVYDANQRLCKTIEPESDATVLEYDNAGNVSYSASGLSLLSASDCNRAEASTSAQRVNRTYDARNRLQILSFSDGRGSQSWEYWPDGLAKKITTYNQTAQGGIVENTFSYNRRRLLTAESITEPGQYSWGLGYAYNLNGSLSDHYYPSGLHVSYAPNALGQPTQAGTYAAGVSYYPNGAIKQFTYGNGIVHTLTQNERQLPDQSVDSGGVLNDSYDYDANGNVAAISDGLAGARGNRTMSYDGLDRLTATTSPMFPGGTAYAYDPLDNLIRVQAPGRDHYYCYDTPSNRLTNIKIGSCSGSSVIGLGYDAQGNLANKNGQLYSFDYGNRLRDVPGKESYRYDGYGRRVSANATMGTIYSLYGQDGALRSQRDERKGEAYDYVTLNGSLVARVTDPNSVIGVPVLTAPASSGGSYTVQWTAVAVATRYELQESFDGGAWQAAYSGTATSAAQSGKPVGNYAYRVRACKNTPCGGWSPTATVVVGQPPGAAPTLSAPASAPNGNYTVSWAAASGATSYVLDENTAGTWTEAYNGQALSKAYAGKPAGSYGYRVKACNTYGCSAVSATATVQALYAPNAPTLTVPGT
ncbi:MAG TPA: RHS repeat protein, partial [Luteimonas sp.]|nr:RHS repeat protein [Luteimonas sp.]